MFKRKSDDDGPAVAEEFEVVPVQVLTKPGWIIGKAHIRKGWNLLSLFDGSKEYISLTDVILEGRPKVIPLFSLHRSAILFVNPENKEIHLSVTESRNRVVHPVSFLLANGSVYGMVELATGVRISTYLSNQTGFILVHDCHYRIYHSGQQHVVDHKEPTLLLNPGAIIGVSEWVKDEP